MITIWRSRSPNESRENRIARRQSAATTLTAPKKYAGTSSDVAQRGAVCGLDNAATVKKLRDFARSFAPSILCVIETQIHRSRVEKLKHTLGYDNSFLVSSSGRSGG
jgi:hypothetical protein